MTIIANIWHFKPQSSTTGSHGLSVPTDCSTSPSSAGLEKKPVPWRRVTQAPQEGRFNTAGHSLLQVQPCSHHGGLVAPEELVPL